MDTLCPRALVGDPIVEPAKAIFIEIHDYLLALGKALITANKPPTLDKLDTSLEAFRVTAEAAASKASAVKGTLVDEAHWAACDHAITFARAFSFTLEQIRTSIEELAECAGVIADD